MIKEKSQIKESKEYTRTISLTATELSFLWKATKEAKKEFKRVIKQQEQRKKEGKFEPGEYVPYDLLKVYESLEKKLYRANLGVENQVIDDLREFHKP